MDQFDIVSDKYKEFVEQDPFRINLHYPGVMDHLKVKSRDLVLDIGFGDGYFDTLLSNKLGVKVIGYDSSEKQIDTAQKRSKNENTFFVATPETFKFPEYFAAAVSVLVLPYADDKEHLKKFLCSAFNHLKIGSRFISVVFNPEFKDFNINLGSRKFDKLDNLSVQVNFLTLPSNKIAFTSCLKQFSKLDYEQAAYFAGFKNVSWFDLKSDLLGIEKYSLGFWDKIHKSQPYQIFIAEKN